MKVATQKTTRVHIITFFLPNLSPKYPAKRAPIKNPIRIELPRIPVCVDVRCQGPMTAVRTNAIIAASIASKV
jgi:hypothetical protein